jgi:hypothetical protein
MSRQDLLIANLKELRGRKDLLSKELEASLSKTKELKNKIKDSEKEITGIIDELSGKITYPILDEIEKEETKTQEIKPITFERVGKRGSDFDCVFFYQGENIFDLSFDKIELKLIGEDPANYKDYLDLSDTAWKELQNADQETLQELINNLTPRPNRFAWKINDSAKPTIITLMKGKERKVVPDSLARLVDIETFNPFKCKKLWEQLEEQERNPQAQEKPKLFKIRWDVSDGLSISKTDSLESKTLNNLDSVKLLDYFSVQNPGLLSDEELQWAWDNYDKEFPWHKEIFDKANPDTYQVVKLSNANVILHDHEQRTFGVLSTQKILAKYGVKRLGALDQNQLKEIWDDLKNGEQNACFNQPSKPAKPTKASKKKLATVGI